MEYDKDSFLAGIAAGRAMKSYPKLDANLVFVYFIDMSYADSLDYHIKISTYDVNRRAEILIDWGDGSTNYVNAYWLPVPYEVNHTYADDGVYKIAVYGAYTDTFNSSIYNFVGIPECVISINTPLLFPKAPLAPYPVGQTPLYYMDINRLKNIQNLPKGLYKNSTDWILLGANFAGCAMLESVPKDMFSYITAIGPSDFHGVSFKNCAELVDIPEDLFPSRLAERISNCKEMFSGCSSLREVPKGLFSDFVNCLTFEDCFNGCTSLVVADELFKDCAVASNFRQVFYGCTALETALDVFSGCRSATTFERAFYGCTSLGEVSSNLFSGCVSVTTFAYCFTRCRNLQTISSGLFSGCVNVTSMSYCFYYTGLTEIPDGLLDSMVKVSDYGSCFGDCYSLRTVPSALFDNNGLTRVYFNSCFYRDSSIVSSVPELWEKFSWHASDSYVSECFYGCTGAANYSAIPYWWRN